MPSLGDKGQGWVWGQFVLGALVIVAAWVGPSWPMTWMRLIGIMMAVLGAAVGTWALYSLGDALTPYPKPRNRGSLVESGPYRVVRHPVYSALLLAMLGVCFTGSWWGLIPLVMLVGWWLAKASVEEQFLRQHYSGYSEYCTRVRYRLIPFVV